MSNKKWVRALCVTKNIRCCYFFLLQWNNTMIDMQFSIAGASLQFFRPSQLQQPTNANTSTSVMNRLLVATKRTENIRNSVVVGLFVDEKATLYNIIFVVVFFPRYSSLGYTDEEKAEVARQLLSLSQVSFADPTK